MAEAKKVPLRHLTVEEYLELSRNQVRVALDGIIKGFDFAKAHRALKGCGWKYQGAASCPTVDKLKVIATDALRTVIQGGSGCRCSSGPFQAEAKSWDSPAVVTLTLSLIPVWNSAVYIDGRVIVARRQFKAAAKKTKAPK